MKFYYVTTYNYQTDNWEIVYEGTNRKKAFKEAGKKKESWVEVYPIINYEYEPGIEEEVVETEKRIEFYRGYGNNFERLE
jgi:hypothetical protein